MDCMYYTSVTLYTSQKKGGGGGKLVKTYTCLRNICTHTPQPLSRADRRGGEMYGTVQRTSSAGRTFQSLPYMFTCIYILLYFTNNKIKYPPPHTAVVRVHNLEDPPSSSVCVCVQFPATWHAARAGESLEMIPGSYPPLCSLVIFHSVCMYWVMMSLSHLNISKLI